MRSLGRSVISVICAAALMSGCGSDASPSPSDARSSAPASAPVATGSAAPPASTPATQEPEHPANVQEAYFRVADAYNPSAARALGVLNDLASTAADRAGAIQALADAERAFGASLDEMEVPSELVGARDALRKASADVEAAIGTLDGSSDGEPLTGVLEKAAEQASAFRQAMVDWSGTSWGHEDAIKELGAGAAASAPGEIWVSSGGWSIGDWRATFTAYVENPWDEYVFDVSVQIAFSPVDGPFGPTQAGTVSGVGPGCRGSITQSVEAPIGLAGIDEIRGQIVHIGEWRSAIEPAVGAR